MNIEINYPAIHATAQRGIRRAAVFLGLGVNAADDQRQQEYLLAKETGIRLLPEKVNEETLQQWKTEFRLWIIGCGFKELVDHFCVFLDQLYHASSLIAKSHSPTNQEKFEYLGMTVKLSKLEKEFAVRCNWRPQLETLYAARNCFVHRLGTVGVDDCEPGRALLALQYVRLASVFQPKEGPEQPMPDIFDPNSLPFTSPSEGWLCARWTPTTIEIPIGEKLQLAPKVLTEILLFADVCAFALLKSAEEFAVKRGVRAAPSSS
jgi:hypothetical protein